MHVLPRGLRVPVFFALLWCAWLSAPLQAHAADLSVSPSSGSVAIGKTISVKVMVDPGDSSINATDGTLAFDSSMLSVSSISRDGSVFSLWTADPTYSNTDGTITFSGGTPTAFSKSGTILTIVFTGKAAGTASVSFTKASVLAADGKGTDVYKTGTGGTYIVTSAAAAPAAAPADTSADTSSADSGGGAPPLSPVIASPTFAKSDSWYGTSTGVFTWPITGDITGVRTLLSQKDNDTPKVALKGGATSTQTVTGIKDGVSYFYVQLKNDSGWGDIGKYKFQVDTAPPNPFTVALQAPGSDAALPKLAFKTDDALSGMDHYEVDVGTSTPITVRVLDVADGTYPVPPQGGGAQLVTIKAFDKAGNMTAASSTLTLPAVAKPKPPTPAASGDAPVQNSSGSLWEEILLVLFALAIGALLTRQYYNRKAVVREKEKLLVAVSEVRDKNDRIFSAMREEFEHLIDNFDAKPQLTPEERDLLESIKEVLDISEELVDTGIEDLKKMVRNQT